MNPSKNDAWRVELELEAHRKDPLGEAAKEALAERGFALAGGLRSVRGFLLPGELPREVVEKATSELLCDPVTEAARIISPGASSQEGNSMVVIRRQAGVADPEGHSATRALQLVEVLLPEGSVVESYRAYRADHLLEQDPFLEASQRALANLVIETVELGNNPIGLHPPQGTRSSERTEVPLRDLDDDALLGISKTMSLALTVQEMRAIRDFYVTEGREPMDVELETLAQTWSEHCKHKTLTGPIELSIDGKPARSYSNLLKETVFAATQKLSPEWCWSVFKDNAGVVALTEDTGVAIKVETHNHPSALDPYGGAGTGIGGVIRDILGTGLGARPFAATDVFCVGPADMERGDLPPGTMHPNRILDGVVAGVRDYGNRMGIPTVSGTVIRHPGYVANPLVFAGCIGEIPRDCVEKEVVPGDLILAIGGRTGRDGIHGATFSSEALHEDSESLDSAAVQIGDPITEKKVLDVMMLARDRRLFRAVTDCGAGGFSSAVGEMGEECGAEVELSHAPLKYPGLSYWEIWISEAQERMVLAVPPDQLEAFEELCAEHEVESVVLGSFTDTQRLRLTWNGETVCDLPMQFLHEGVPQPTLQAEAATPSAEATPWPKEVDWDAFLPQLCAHPQVASKEWVVRQYDHEVQGGTVLKPYQGPDGQGPGDGTVIKPNLSRPEGVALGCGIAPAVSMLDPWAGAATAIDEAIRNVVAAGGNPHRTAILDNFCWGDCRKPDRLGSLVLAAEACQDAAIAFGAPFVSGKDSLNNEYRVGDEEVAIPPTLLCTAIAPLEDASRAVATPFKAAGNLLVLVGPTGAEGGGSVAAELLDIDGGGVPRPDLALAPQLFDAMHACLQSGIVKACHDLSEGGLLVAALEMGFGSGLGVRLDASRISSESDSNPIGDLLMEGPSRFLCEIQPDDMGDFAKYFRTLPITTVGEVLPEPTVAMHIGDDLIHQSPLAPLLEAYQSEAR